MKSWQQRWLWVLLVVSIYHFVRDILQTFGIQTFISTIVVKQGGIHTGIWNPINTYIIEIVMFVCTLYLLKRRQFGKLGYFTVFVAIMTLLFFFIYWFLL
jgi:hypothetical protein